MSKKALDANFDNSDDHEFVVSIFSGSIHLLYILNISFIASLPVLELSPPIKTLSGLIKSSIAVPSAKNSGFDITSNLPSEKMIFKCFFDFLSSS